MNLRLPLLRYALWLAVFAAVGYGRTSTSQVVGQSHSPSMSPVMTPARSPNVVPPTIPAPEAKANQSPSSDLARLETRVRPAVIWVSVFDAKGNLLRTQSGFFVSPDGRFVTTEHTIEGGINAVAKTGDGGIYNVSGILAASKALDLAVLQAEVKRVTFVESNKNGHLSPGEGVMVIGSALAGNEGSVRETTIASQNPERLEIAGAIPQSSVGSPVVNRDGDVVGVVTSAGEKTIARPSAALDSLLSRAADDTRPNWAAPAETRATPRPTPKPRLIYAPAPAFPPRVAQAGLSGTGRFRLSFDAQGNVTNIQLIQSTGNRIFDESAIQTLRQWKCSPGQGWVVTVPVTFRTR
ncbi:MAG TPA: TonB family protein [Candidatus Udaeobacter sp.]